MYDISGWSLGELWGATRASVADGQGIDANTAPVKQHQSADGGIAPGSGGYALLVDTAAAVKAVNELLDAGVALRRTDDGTVYAPASAGTIVQRLASSDGLDFTRGSAPAGAERLEDVEIAASATADELFVLERQLGFEVEPISNAALNSGAQLDGYDVLFASTGLRYTSLNAAAMKEVDDFRAAGGGFVGREFTGARFNDEAGILDVDYVRGDTSANGIARVDNAAGSPVGSTAPGQTFVYSPIWFENLGSGVDAAQRFGSGDFFFSGHWVGQEDASGDAVVVHGERDGGRAVLFGSNPLFRAHPRGLYPQAAHGLWWSGSR